MSVLDTDYVRQTVNAKASGSAVDPSSLTVKMAFTVADPVTGDWKTASWDTDTTTNPDTYAAQCLVGPSGTITLTAGNTYRIWIKITTSPELPVLRGDLLRIV